ncbi:MAG: 2-C-methyl-D-erythritol 2,4-cyclodiphosphate synthase [Dehalococcoidia bacterium]
MSIRVGSGYDAHRLEDGRKLVLCGIEIPFEKGLLGWSDADVSTHAIIDALLGAAALGDIGTHFPSDDQRYRDISSMELLHRTGMMIAEKGLRIVNFDVTIIAEEPKLAPFFDRMRNKLADTLSLSEDRIGVKAKTNDGLGFTGMRQGIAALAVALVGDSDEDI